MFTLRLRGSSNGRRGDAMGRIVGAAKRAEVGDSILQDPLLAFARF